MVTYIIYPNKLCKRTECYLKIQVLLSETTINYIRSAKIPFISSYFSQHSKSQITGQAAKKPSTGA